MYLKLSKFNPPKLALMTQFHFTDENTEAQRQNVKSGTWTLGVPSYLTVH